MNTYIALFRGINIGGRHILPMKDLIRILEDLGYEKLRTYIQSGNVVFCSTRKQKKKMADEIGSRIHEDFGFKPEVLLLEIPELEAAIKGNPFSTEEGKALHFFFMDSTPVKPDLDKLMGIKSKTEEFYLHKNVFYLYTPDGIGRSKLAAKVGQVLGVPVTARNWNTVSKLSDMVG